MTYILIQKSQWHKSMPDMQSRRGDSRRCKSHTDRLPSAWICMTYILIQKSQWHKSMPDMQSRQGDSRRCKSHTDHWPSARICMTYILIQRSQWHKSMPASGTSALMSGCCCLERILQNPQKTRLHA